MNLPRPPVLVITDRGQARQGQTGAGLESVAEAAFRAGCRWLLLREKDLDARDRLTLLDRLVVLGRGFGAQVMISADSAVVWAAALATGAAGVHLPGASDVAAARTALGAQALIGYSAHELDGAVAAARSGADYLTLSPVFASLSKAGYGPRLGLEGLARLAARVPAPVIALGGVNAANAAACLSSGAAGVAVMGAVMGAADPETEVGKLLAAVAGAAPAKLVDKVSTRL